MQNFKPGGLARFGLDYDTVSAVNPAVIYASISGFGSGGGKDLPGYDLMVQAMSGLMSLTGDPDGPPYRAGISAFDVIAGLHTTIAILAALNHRNATGEGQHLDACLMASAMSGMVNQTSAYAAAGVVPFRMGNSHPSLFPYEPLPTGDGELIVTAGNDAQFRKLCDVIGAPELPDDPRFATNPGRTANRDMLKPLLAEKLAAKSAGEWFDVLIAVGVPCGPINTVDKGVEFAREDRPRPDRHRGRRETAPGRRCGTRSPSPRRRPAIRSRRRNSTSKATRSAPGWRPRKDDQAWHRSTRPRSAPRTPTRSPCSARTWPMT